MAVAARILGSRTLAAEAQWKIADVPGKGAYDSLSSDTGKIREVIQDGSNRIAESLTDAKTDAQRSQIYAVLKIVGSWLDPKRIEAQQELAPTVPAIVVDQAQQAGEKGFNFLEFINGIITGKRPGYITEGKWPFVKWGTRIVVGGVVLSVAGVALKPYTAPIRRLYQRSKAPDLNPTAGALSVTHHKNPRKRRRRRK